ncbi:MAG: hypothetical protein ABF460_08635, partial [Oenococcus sp.]|uniref:hypothetical protein n=2 Tax=Oenococcus sp. TaxID=1979414 RepID=UPI0039E9CE98
KNIKKLFKIIWKRGIKMKKMIIKNWRRVLVIILSSSLYAIASITSASYYGYIVQHSHNKEITLFFMMIAAGITVVLPRWVFDVLNQTLMVRFVGKIIYEIREKIIWNHQKSYYRIRNFNNL